MIQTSIVVSLIFYLLLVLAIGVFVAKKAQSSETSYWIANKFLGKISGSFAVFAVVGSSSTAMGIIGLTYGLGIPFAAAVAAGFTLQFPIAAYLTAKPLQDRNLITLGDYFKERVGGKHVQVLYSALTLIFIAAYIVPQLTASGIVGEWLFAGHYQTSVIVLGFVFLLYSSIGGMWAVTYTDIIQGAIMVAAGIGLAIVALFVYGVDILPLSLEYHPPLGRMGMPIFSALGLAFIWALWGLVAPMTVMRILTMQSGKSARRSLMIASIFAFLSVAFVAVVVAMAAAIITQGTLENPDMSFLIVMETLFPPILTGFLVVSLLAAIMSSTDSFLLTCSATVAHDIYKGLINPNASEKTVIRIGMVAIWVIGITVIAISLGDLPLISILAAWASTGLLSSFTGPILLGLYWPKTTRHGIFAGMLSGFILYMILNLTGIVPALSEILFTIPASFLFTIVFSSIKLSSDKYVEEDSV